MAGRLLAEEDGSRREREHADSLTSLLHLSCPCMGAWWHKRVRVCLQVSIFFTLFSISSKPSAVVVCFIASRVSPIILDWMATHALPQKTSSLFAATNCVGGFVHTQSRAYLNWKPFEDIFSHNAVIVLLLRRCVCAQWGGSQFVAAMPKKVCGQHIRLNRHVSEL